MPVSNYETVKAALEKDDRQYLKDIEADLKKRLDGVSVVNNKSFFHARNFGAESCIPKVRSRENKNTRYSIIAVVDCIGLCVCRHML
jgi:hypothetical protein